MSRLAIWALSIVISLVSVAGIVSVLKNQARKEFNADVRKESAGLEKLNRSGLNPATRQSDAAAITEHRKIDAWKNGKPLQQCSWSCPLQVAQRLIEND